MSYLLYVIDNVTDELSGCTIMDDAMSGLSVLLDCGDQVDLLEKRPDKLVKCVHSQLQSQSREQRLRAIKIAGAFLTSELPDCGD